MLHCYLVGAGAVQTGARREVERAGPDYLLEFSHDGWLENAPHMRMQVRPRLVFAESAEQAYEAEHAHALERWPGSEGWTGHSVHVMRLPRAELIKALRTTEVEAHGGAEDNTPDNDSGLTT